MDQLEVSVAHDDSPASNDGISIFVEVKMNGVLLPDILDIAEFFEALKGNGIFPLLTSCWIGVVPFAILIDPHTSRHPYSLLLRSFRGNSFSNTIMTISIAQPVRQTLAHSIGCCSGCIA